MEFKVGDVVFLKNNPERLMTVSYVFGEVKTARGLFHKLCLKLLRKFCGIVDGDVHCNWFDGLECEGNFFTAKELIKKDSDTTRPILEEEDAVFLKSNPERLLSVSLVLGKTMIYEFQLKRMVKTLSNFGFVDGDVQCMWLAGKEFQEVFFRAEMLVKTHIE